MVCGFSPDSWLTTLLKRDGCKGMNVVLGFGMDWSVLLKAWLLALKNFIDSVKVLGNK
jgi:hypothetical protein